MVDANPFWGDDVGGWKYLNLFKEFQATTSSMARWRHLHQPQGVFQVFVSFIHLCCVVFTKTLIIGLPLAQSAATARNPLKSMGGYHHLMPWAQNFLVNILRLRSGTEFPDKFRTHIITLPWRATILFKAINQKNISHYIDIQKSGFIPKSSLEIRERDNI